MGTHVIPDIYTLAHNNITTMIISQPISLSYLQFKWHLLKNHHLWRSTDLHFPNSAYMADMIL